MSDGELMHRLDVPNDFLASQTLNTSSKRKRKSIQLDSTKHEASKNHKKDKIESQQDSDKVSMKKEKEKKKDKKKNDKKENLDDIQTVTDHHDASNDNTKSKTKHGEGHEQQEQTNSKRRIKQHKKHTKMSTNERAHDGRASNTPPTKAVENSNEGIQQTNLQLSANDIVLPKQQDMNTTDQPSASTLAAPSTDFNPVSTLKGKRRLTKKERKAENKRKKVVGVATQNNSTHEQGVSTSEAIQPQEGLPRKKKKKKKNGTKQKPKLVAATTDVPTMCADATQILDSIVNQTVKGTLSDQLNAKHQHFNATLKARWKSFSKKERAAIVAADRNLIDAEAANVLAIKHPFKVHEDDHCESPSEAYVDLKPMLELLAQKLNKDPSELKIYDPYYCAGAVVRHLTEVGFPNVYNKCEDFYRVIEEGRIPEHDVVVTNPPYSGDNVERLLRWSRENAKPFVLLMPNYFCTKPYYIDALGGDEVVANTMSYLYPRKRYAYWTPKGMRTGEKIQKQHSARGGYRTSPFISFWYMNLTPTASQSDIVEWKKYLLSNDRTRQEADMTALALCVAALPPSVHPGSAPGWAPPPIVRPAGALVTTGMISFD